MTLQQIFDRVATHLLRQGKRAVEMVGENEGGCRYRQGELRCAVGCLIPASIYSPDIEGTVMGGPGEIDFNCESGDRLSALLQVLVDAGVPIDEPRVLDLLSALQAVHDRCTVKKWRSSLRDVAEYFGLSPAVLR